MIWRDKYSAIFSSLTHNNTTIFISTLSKVVMINWTSAHWEKHLLLNKKKKRVGVGLQKVRFNTYRATYVHKMGSTFHHSSTWRHNFLYWSLIVLSLYTNFETKLGCCLLLSTQIIWMVAAATSENTEQLTYKSMHGISRCLELKMCPLLV